MASVATQASGHSSVKRDRQKSVRNPFKSRPKVKEPHGACRLTVLREEDDVVGEDPGVQGELCELLLQVLAGLWTAS